MVTVVVGTCSWHSNFGYEYCFDSQTETYATAYKTCRSRNSSLASITSDAECDYVASLMSVNFLTVFKYNYNLKFVFKVQYKTSFLYPKRSNLN